MHPDMTTTTFTIDGFRVVQTLGLVRGISVRSRSVFGSIGAKFETLLGGNITILTTLCEKTRSEAFEIMIGVADRLGANGVVGVRYDATEIMSGVTEVLCYGTAVILEQE
ncbi:MAG: YbjQ family protein [Gemmatimonadota bacterium]